MNIVCIQVPFDGAVVSGSADVAFLARQSSKPGRAPPADGSEAWVAVSTPAFAAAALASGADSDSVAALLWASAAEALRAAAHAGAPLPRPAWLAAQRWGGALQAPALEEPCLVHAHSRFAACGDWAAGGGGAAAAVRSGDAAAQAIAASFGL